MRVQGSFLPTVLAILILGTAIASSKKDQLREGGEPLAKAEAQLVTKDGKKVGTATFEETSMGVTLHAEVSGLPPGKHGIHVHQVGKCEGPDFKSAGDHFRTGKKLHGRKNPKGAHEGDLPNLEVQKDGKGTLHADLKGVTLKKGEKNSLFSATGTALVIHAKEDDEKTDPSGNSGDRIACGVIVAPKAS